MKSIIRGIACAALVFAPYAHADDISAPTCGVFFGSDYGTSVQTMRDRLAKMTTQQLREMRSCVKNMPPVWSINRPSSLAGAQQFEKYAGTDVSVPELGCQIFDASGAAIAPDRFDGNQRDSVLGCGLVANMLRDDAMSSLTYELEARDRNPRYAATSVSSRYEAPTPQLGCKVFDVSGRALADSELTDKQRYQAASCVQSADLIRDRAALSAQIQGRLDAISAENHRRTAALADTPAAPGTPGPIAYPLPANTPTIILQTQ
ncbi:LOB domain containing-protein [Burkholderia multivorans]|uniref:hypothetical protein n=1 Tax=Burkholderia multivorans TaxID=87883 RepID=UPI00158BDB43|nr:hypothetical protein [Burkholderia multivorans]MBU9145415.1 LOB domain containing-protein [Burkholderia multivorans]MBU9561279.1 LOB domain containing-protein [Burkholderia multivorans]MCA8336959.1 LOB domain containing-protein [Burkholderia multivorans]HEF4770844.1 hypothetical protein [Burkholderia multivorans]HEJ2441391.1 hypothetical protein [Burkholderia multivorans]